MYSSVQYIYGFSYLYSVHACIFEAGGVGTMYCTVVGGEIGEGGRMDLKDGVVAIQGVESKKIYTLLSYFDYSHKCF